MRLDLRQLTGLDETHLVETSGGHRLQAEAAEAFASLQRDAAVAGFDLAVASSFRSFSRQLAIWNAKAAGERPVHDDSGEVVVMESLSPEQKLHAILRFSALPGASRHHWGTDLDVYDAAVLAPSDTVQLVPEEVSTGGVFDPLHRWLDERMAADESHGFFRPYGVDRGGVAPERWHLSYVPLAVSCARQFNEEVLLACWHSGLEGEGLLLQEEVETCLPALLQRYVVLDGGWCPAQYADRAG